MINASILNLVNALGGKDNLRGLKLRGGYSTTVIFKVRNISKVKLFGALVNEGRVSFLWPNLIRVKLNKVDYNSLIKNLGDLQK